MESCLEPMPKLAALVGAKSSGPGVRQADINIPALIQMKKPGLSPA